MAGGRAKFNRILAATRRPGSRELKWVDSTAIAFKNVSPDNCSGTPPSVVVNLLTVGSSQFQRTGRRIAMKFFQLKGIFTQNTIQVNPDMCRILVVYDRQTNGITPTASTIMSNTDQTGTQYATGYGQFKDLNKSERFLILADRKHLMPESYLSAAAGNTIISSTSAASAGALDSPTLKSIYVDMFIPLRGLETQFIKDSSPGAIGDMASGSLTVYFISHAPANAVGWQFQGCSRVVFADA